MSLTYLYNKLESMDSWEQYTYIKNIFSIFGIKPRIDIDEVFKPKSDKEVQDKNPLGYLIMELGLDHLDELIPRYLRELCGCSTFDDLAQERIIETIYKAVDCIDMDDPDGLVNLVDCNKDDMLDVFLFGHGKYPEWNFLQHNPYQLVMSLFRHLYKSEYICYADEESNISHKAHAASNIRMIELILRNKRGHINET